VTLVAIWAADAAMRDGIANLLEDAAGLEVVGAAENAAALVDLLQSVRIDVIVMVSESDDMPAVAHRLGAEAAVIALVKDSARAVEALQAGVRAVLLAPADRAEIAAAIQAVAAGLSVLSADLLDSLLQAGGSDEAPSTAEALTPRELEVLALIAAGGSNKLIARRLGISVHTAKFHVAGVFEKLGASSRAEAVAIAARLGLVLL
jgi:DNA-binding NarL/FixJ family response regulator